MKRFLAVSVLAFAVVMFTVSPTRVRAQDVVSEAARAEARERFGRALELYEEGLLEQALEEFRRAYAIAPTPQVLYNLGLVYAGLGRAVEAVDALERYAQQAGPSMAAERREEVDAELRRQRARIAFVTVVTSTPGATVSIDGVDRGAPGAEPFAVTSGTILVEVHAPGHEPLSATLRLASGVRETLTASLAETRAAVGRIRVTSTCEGCEVLVDGATVGETPLADTLPVAPGDHVVEVRRAGHQPVRAEVNVGVAEQEEVTASFPISSVDTATAAHVRLRLPVGPTEVLVDGESVGTPEALLVAPGSHEIELRIPERMPATEHVVVGPSETLELTPRLRWDDEATRLAHQRGRTQNAWITVGVAIGLLAIAAPFAAVLIHGAREAEEFRNAHPELSYRLPGENGCMPPAGGLSYCSGSGPALPPLADWVETSGGWLAVPIGLASLATVLALIGVPLLLTNDNDQAVLDGANLRVDVGAGSLAVRGAF